MAPASPQHPAPRTAPDVPAPRSGSTGRRAAGPRSRYVADGVHVLDHGGPADAPQVLLVHGLGASHAGWQRLAERLVRRHRVLAVDLPGHGRSPLGGRASTVESHRAVLAQVVDEVAEGRVGLVGHSMGATLSAWHAADRPGTVSSLTLLAPPAPRHRTDAMTPSMAVHVALCAWPWLARRHLGGRLRRLGPEEYVRSTLERTCAALEDLAATARELAVEVAGSPGGVEEVVEAYVASARSMGLVLARSAEYRAALEAVRAPTLAVAGDLDRILHPDSLVRLAALRPDWQVERLDGVGHSPHLEAVDATAELVRRHLAEARDPEPRRTEASEPVS